LGDGWKDHLGADITFRRWWCELGDGLDRCKARVLEGAAAAALLLLLLLLSSHLGTDTWCTILAKSTGVDWR
jgi:hypothetical protein